MRGDGHVYVKSLSVSASSAGGGTVTLPKVVSTSLTVDSGGLVVSVPSLLACVAQTRRD